jgi:hypothetical protein
VLKATVLVAFVVVSITVYCLQGLTLDVSTQPVLDFLPQSAFNLTLTVEPLLDGARPLLIKEVEDYWLENLLNYRGFNSKDAATLIDSSEGTTEYTFPVGWAPQNSTRTVTVFLNSTDYSRAGGLRWVVQSGIHQTGVAPNERLAHEKPSITGVVATVPTRKSFCAAYTRQVIAVPYSNRVIPGYMERHGLLPLPGGNGDRALVSKACRVQTQDAYLVVPGRAGVDAIIGPQKLACLEEIKLFITAVPRTQMTPQDALAGTSTYTRKAYDLGLDGVDIRMNNSFALPGLWQV